MEGNRAFVAADAAGVEIYDVSNVAAPVRMGTYHTLSPAYDVVIVGHHACIAELEHFEVADVTHPEAALEVWSRSGSWSTYAGKMAVSGNLVYVAADDIEVTQRILRGDLSILDLSDPRLPVLVYEGAGCRDVAVWQSRAWLAAKGYFGGTPAVDLLDVSNPRQPSPTSTWVSAGRPAGLVTDGSRVPGWSFCRYASREARLDSGRTSSASIQGAVMIHDGPEEAQMAARGRTWRHDGLLLGRGTATAHEAPPV